MWQKEHTRRKTNTLKLQLSAAIPSTLYFIKVLSVTMVQPQFNAATAFRYAKKVPVECYPVVAVVGLACCLGMLSWILNLYSFILLLSLPLVFCYVWYQPAQHIPNDNTHHDRAYFCYYNKIIILFAICYKRKQCSWYHIYLWVLNPWLLHVMCFI